jgi:hypothetical protein
MARGNYERLTPQAIDEVWVRLRVGDGREADGARAALGRLPPSGRSPQSHVCARCPIRR